MNKTLMIKQKISYTVEFTEEQLKELYNILRNQKDDGRLTHMDEIILIYQELQKMFEDRK